MSPVPVDTNGIFQRNNSVKQVRSLEILASLLNFPPVARWRACASEDHEEHCFLVT
jgi:hypothetical protein